MDLSRLTLAELKADLQARGIDFPRTANREHLINLLQKDINIQAAAREATPVYRSKVEEVEVGAEEDVREEQVAPRKNQVQPKKQPKKARQRYVPQGEIITENQLRSEYEMLPVEVVISSIDQADNVTKAARLTIGNEFGSKTGVFKLGQPVIMPEVMVEALKNRTVAQVTQAAQINKEAWLEDANIMAMSSIKTNSTYANARQQTPKYTVNELRRY